MPRLKPLILTFHNSRKANLMKRYTVLLRFINSIFHSFLLTRDIYRRRGCNQVCSFVLLARFSPPSAHQSHDEDFVFAFFALHLHKFYILMSYHARTYLKLTRRSKLNECEVIYWLLSFIEQTRVVNNASLISFVHYVICDNYAYVCLR